MLYTKEGKNKLDYDKFYECIKDSVEKFKKLDKKQPIRIISHLDCDGVAACSILIKALNRENRKYSISIVQQVNERIIDELANESYNLFFLTDLGSGYMSSINSKLKDRTHLISEIRRRKLSARVSVKPSQLGLKINPRERNFSE